MFCAYVTVRVESINKKMSNVNYENYVQNFWYRYQSLINCYQNLITSIYQITRCTQMDLCLLFIGRNLTPRLTLSTPIKMKPVMALTGT